MSTSPETHHDQLEINRLGLWLFFLSESMIFVILMWTWCGCFFIRRCIWWCEGATEDEFSEPVT